MKETVVAIFAHPDDECLLAGGTLASLAAAGSEVHVLCLTHGEQGPIAEESDVRRETLGEVRAAELQCAAKELGLRQAVCLDFPDGELEWVDVDRLTRAVTRYLRSWQPALVITFGPEGWYWHPDHIVANGIVRRAVEGLAGTVLRPAVYWVSAPLGLMTELKVEMERRGLPAGFWGLSPDDFGVDDDAITHTVDVGAFVPVKLRALHCHRTQFVGDSIFRHLPHDLALRYLGREFFTCADVGNQSGHLSPPAATLSVRGGP